MKAQREHPAGEPPKRRGAAEPPSSEARKALHTPPPADPEPPPAPPTPGHLEPETPALSAMARFDSPESDIVVTRMAIEKGWIRPAAIPSDKFENLVRRVAELGETMATAGKVRGAINAGRFLLEVQESNRKIVALMDKTQRLDSGKPTSIRRHLSEESKERVRKIVANLAKRQPPEVEAMGPPPSPDAPAPPDGDTPSAPG